MLTFLVNSPSIAVKTITVQYFEPGHRPYVYGSRLGARRNRSQMRQMKKVYDFDDFTNCVKAAKCTTVQLNYHDFKASEKGDSYYKMKKQFQRILLEDIVTVQCRRQSEYLFVKTLEIQKFHEMPFLKQNFKLEEPEEKI